MDVRFGWAKCRKPLATFPAPGGGAGSSLTPPEDRCSVPRRPEQQNNKRITQMFRLPAFVRAAVVATFASLAACATSPPVQEMSDARQAIAAAEEADAGRLAAQTLDDARRFLETAEQLLREQAYGAARLNAVRAKNRAVQALEASQTAAE